MQLTKCCCGCSLRGGTIGIGIYTLITSLIMGALYAYSLKSTQDLRKSLLHPDSMWGVLDDHQLKVAEIALTISLVLICLWALTAVLLFCAICSKVRGMLMPWVILTAIFTGFSVYDLWAQISLLIHGHGSSTVFFKLGSGILGILLNLYFILVITSYFKVKMEENTNQGVTLEQQVMLPTSAQKPGMAPASTTVCHAPGQDMNQGYAPKPGYGYPPTQQAQFGYPPAQQPGAGYPPPQQVQYGYPPAQQPGVGYPPGPGAPPPGGYTAAYPPVYQEKV